APPPRIRTSLTSLRVFRPGRKSGTLFVLPIPFDLSRARAILMDVPRHGKLAYCLLRDPRVPMAPKVALLGALAVVASPLDFPGWIPILGDFDMLALGILAVKVFVDACPRKIV